MATALVGLRSQRRRGFQLFATQFSSSTILQRFLGTATITTLPETIAYEEFRAHPHKPYTSTAIIIHGFLGSGRNWRSFSRNLVSTLSNSCPSSNWRMVLVDMRNHGKSAEKRLDPPHDMVNAAKDIADLVKGQSWSWPEVIVGHSMGGKVASQFAESCSRGHYGHSALSPKQESVDHTLVGDRGTPDYFESIQVLKEAVNVRRWKDIWCITGIETIFH